jgi:hypothetical protein
MSAVKRIEFVSDNMSYIMFRGHWLHAIVLKGHAPTENEIDDVKDSFYEELENVFHEFPEYRIRMLLGDSNAKLGR